MGQESALGYIRHGQTPFFRLPSADFSQRGPAVYSGADAVLLGVPWDGSVIYRPGARFAPHHVRRVSACIQSYHPFHGIDVFNTLRVVDGGNVPVPPIGAETSRELVLNEVRNVITAGALPFVVGGDHSIALSIMRALFERYGPLTVIHMDAHLDASTDEVWGERYHNGTQFRHAINEGLIAPKALFQVGIRASWTRADEGHFARTHAGEIFSMERIDDEGISSIARHLAMRVGRAPVYLSFDMDVFDPAFAPATSNPVAGGITSREALRFIRTLAGINLVGMDLVEIVPEFDHGDMTLHLGAQMLFEALSLAAVNRRN